MVTAAVAAVVVALVAVLDHRHERGRLAAIDVATWFCQHQNTHCDHADRTAIHNAWERREYGYKGAEVLLAVVFAGATFQFVRARRRN
jgi:hypothetical protein